jgi:hypothetical protein
MKNKFITFIIALLGIIFLIGPMTIDSFNRHLQNVVFTRTHDNVIQCRANLVITTFEHSTIMERNRIQKSLDDSCGRIPSYNDFTPDEMNGVMSFYNWIGQKVTFIPL